METTYVWEPAPDEATQDDAAQPWRTGCGRDCETVNATAASLASCESERQR